MGGLVAAARGPGGNLSPLRFCAFFAAATLLRAASSATYMSDIACQRSIGNFFTRAVCASAAPNGVTTSLSGCKFLSQRSRSQQWELTSATSVHTRFRLNSAVFLRQVKQKGFLSYSRVGCNNEHDIHRIRVHNHSRNSSCNKSRTRPAGSCTGRSVLIRANSVSSNLMCPALMRSCSLAFHTARTRVLRKLRTVQSVTQTSGDAADRAATLRCSNDEAAKNLAAIAAILRREATQDSFWDAIATPRPMTATTMARQDVAAPADLRSAATLFSPPFPRAVPLAYEIVEPAEHPQNQKLKVRQQLGRGLPLSCSRKRSACSTDGALETKVIPGVETDMDQTGPSRDTVGKDEEMRHAMTNREEASAYPLVVVLHGMFRCRDNMKPLCARLNAEKVVAADLRNHGDSPFTRTMFLQDMAADVLLLLQHLRERFPSASRCILVGHSLGGQVAMAAAIRSWYANTTAVQQQTLDPGTHKTQSIAADDRPTMVVEGVAALDICPVNYYRWPLPSGGKGQQNVRDLVELVARLDLRELEEQLQQQRQRQQQRELQQSKSNEDFNWGAALSTQSDTSWRNCSSRSLLTLLVEEEVEEPQVTALHRDEAEKAGSQKERRSATQPQIVSQRSMPNRGDTEATQHQEDVSWQTNMHSESPAQTSSSRRRAKRRLRWRMNLESLRDAFRSETLKWDIPLPVEASPSAAAAASSSLAEPAAVDRSSPTDVSTTAVVGKAAAATLADDDSEVAVKILEREYDSVAGFKEAPPKEACSSDRPLLLLRGGCSPWVDVDHHWEDITAFFPSAKLQTIPRASHAVHDDELYITAAAINTLLQSKVKEAAEE